jgi:hypothetical protein
MSPACGLSTLLTSILIWSSYLCLGPLGNSFSSGCLTTFCTHFWLLLCVLHGCLIWSPEWYLAKSTNYEAPRSTISSKLLSLVTSILLSNAHSIKLLGRGWGNEGHAPKWEEPFQSSVHTHRGSRNP